MQRALELEIYRTSDGVAMVEIPNGKPSKGPAPLSSDHFKIWLSYRAFKVHGFVASSATLNAVIRTLTGIAMFDEETPTLGEQPELHPTAEPEVTVMPRLESEPLIQTSPGTRYRDPATKAA